MKNLFKQSFPISIIAVFAIVLAAGFAKKAEPLLNQKNMDLSLCPEDNFLSCTSGSCPDKVKIPDDNINNDNSNLQAEKEDKALKRALHWVLGILAATVIAGFLVRLKLGRKFRVLFLLAAVVVIGFFKGACPCMISSFIDMILWFFGTESHWYKFLWFLGLIPITYIFGRVWCGWVCHIGALQEFLFLGSKFQALKSELANKIMKFLQYLLLVILLSQLFITKTNLWCRIDPFLSAYNLFSATTTGLALLALMLLSSIFIFRPFCRAACPIGLILGWICKIPRASILEETSDCIVCSICSETCQLQAIKRKKEEESFSLSFDNKECNVCGDCMSSCDKNAVHFTRTKKKQKK